jgi:hypothetical protein
MDKMPIRLLMKTAFIFLLLLFWKKKRGAARAMGKRNRVTFVSLIMVGIRKAIAISKNAFRLILFFKYNAKRTLIQQTINMERLPDTPIVPLMTSPVCN